MGNIRNVKFAALDKKNEFTKLNSSVEFISRQNINIEGPFDRFQIVQIALTVCRSLEKIFDNNDNTFKIYNSYCPKGVQLGFYLQNDKNFRKLLISGQNEEQVLDYIFSCIV
jgi:hypothetical protein